MDLKSFSPKSVFITGCNRGIGLEFVVQFLKLPSPPKHVFATFINRDPPEELRALAKDHPSVHLIMLDVANFEGLPDIVKTVEELTGEDGLNMLVNNAAIAERLNVDEVTPDAMRSHFEINSIAPLMLVQAFLPLLKKAASSSTDSGLCCSKAAIFNLSSKVASCADNRSGSSYAYRPSKVALNMITKSLSVDLKPFGIMAITINPGWVQTEMGGPGALITTQESVQGMLSVMAQLTEEKTGTFLDFSGVEVPW